MEEKIRLVKNQKIKLTKVTDELRKVTAGMGWKPSVSSKTWDLDQTLIILDDNGKYVRQISYKNAERSHEFYYHGDDLVGGSGNGKNDDEMIDINFHKLDSRYSRLIVIMNIYQAYGKGQDLSRVRDAYIHLWDVDARKDLVEYPIENTDKFKNKTGMFVGEFYKKDGEWEFQAIGEPVRVKDIEEMVEIIKDKYSRALTTEQSWEEFLKNYNCNGSSASGNPTSSKPRRSLWSRIFGE